jgi:hypothetical protein
MLNLPITHPKTSQAQYQKPEAVKELERLSTNAARLKHTSFPIQALAPRKYRDDTANSLTCCIVAYINLMGGFASRISNHGTYSTKLRKYIPGTSRKGLSDIMATYHGKSLHIEVKIGRDRQSEAQKRTESEVTGAGGQYFIARSFSEVKEWFDNI